MTSYTEIYLNTLNQQNDLPTEYFNNVVNTENIWVGGNIIPSLDIQYSLGTVTNKWKDLYLSGNAIYLNNTRISSDPVTNGIVIRDNTNKMSSITTSYINITDPLFGSITRIEKTAQGIIFNEYSANNELVSVTSFGNYITSSNAPIIIKDIPRIA